MPWAFSLSRPIRSHSLVMRFSVRGRDKPSAMAPTMGRFDKFRTGIAVVRDFAFEIGIGQVVQGDGSVQVKQVAGLGKQRVLKSRMAFPENVGGTVQGYQWRKKANE